MSERIDRRVARTRDALLGAFNHLLLHDRRRQRDIKVGEIVDRANVGRSTFYEHFSGADAIFLEAARHPFGQLADALTGVTGPEALVGLLDHFWENRALARDALGRLDVPITRMVAEMVEERLAAQGMAAAIPLRLAARQLAESGLAPVRGWVSAEAPCTSAALAAAIHRGAAALRAALTEAEA